MLELDSPKTGQPVEYYIEYFLNAETKRSVFERNLGFVSWCQGKALLEARKVCRKKGSWSDFLSAIGMNEKTAYHLRRIAGLVLEEQARKMGYTEMLGMVYPSYKNESEQPTPDDAPAPKKVQRQSKTDASDLCEFSHFESRLKRMTEDAHFVTSKKLVESHRSPLDATLAFRSYLGQIKTIVESLQKLESELTRRTERLA